MAEETQEVVNSGLGNLRPDATIGIQPYILRKEEIDNIVRTEAEKGAAGNAPKALATDLVNIFSASDFKEEIAQDPNFLSYDLLRSGKANILNFIPAYADKEPIDRQLTDQDINILFSNAKKADFARPFFTELAKTAPATYVGIKTAGAVGSRIIPPAVVSGPAAPVLTTLALLTTGTAALGTMGLTYFAGQKIEDELLGPIDPITPTSRSAYESYKTLGAFTGSIFAPWLFKETVDLGYNAAVKNLVGESSPPVAARMAKIFENMIKGTATLAKKSPISLAGAEVVSTGGAGVGAYVSEEMYPTKIAPRLLFEFMGANTLYSTFLRVVPNALKGLKDTDVVGGLANKQQQKMFDKINKAYDLYGSKEKYDQLIDSLTNPTFIKELEEAFPGIKFTAAQQSGDPFIMAIEGVKAKGNQKLDAARKQNATKAESFLVGLIQALVEKGDDASLKSAAEIRTSIFSNHIKLAYEEKLEKFLEAAEDLEKQPGQTAKRSKAQLSVQMFNLLDDSITAAKKRERELWAKVGNIPLIQPLGPDVKKVDLPNFLKTWESILPKDASVREEFLKKVPVLANFITNAREDLGLKPLINLTKEEQKTINKFQKTAENFQIKLAGFDEENILAQALKEAKDLDDKAKVEFFRTYAYRNLQITGEAATQGEKMLMSALNAYGDLSASKVTATQRAAFRSQTPLVNTKPISAAQLVEIRSRALSLARSLAENSETRDLSRRVGKFAEALLEDLDVDGFGKTYNIARAYSRGKNEAFNRAIMGKASNLPPETALELFVKSNPSLTLNRVRQLNTLAEFFDKEGIKISDELRKDKDFISTSADEPMFTTMSNLVDGIMRSMKSSVSKKVFNANTGKEELKLNADALAQFKKDNAEVLETLPALKADLQNVITAKNALEVFEKTRKRGLEIANNQKELSKLLNGSSPTLAITEAMNADNPNKALNNIFSLQRMAKKDRGPGVSRLPQFNEFSASGRRAAKIEEAGLDLSKINEGFKRAILQHAFIKAGGEGMFDISTFAKALYGPLKKDPNNSLMDIVKTYNIFSDAEFNKLRLMTSQFLKIKAADAAGKLNDPDFIEKAGPALDFYIGMGGSALGTRTYGMLMGGSSGPGAIKAAQVGVNTLRDFLIKLPQTKKMAMIDEVFLNPKLTAQLLKKPTNERDAKRLQETIIETLTKSFGNVARQGVPIVGPKVGEAITPEGDAEKERFLLRQRQLEEMKKRQAPKLSLNNSGAKSALPTTDIASVSPSLNPVPTASGPVNRQRFAAVFPEDRALIEASGKQGISSLFG